METTSTGQTSSASVDVALAYIDALQRKDKEGILSLLTDDFELEVPNNIAGTNDRSDSWRGIEAAAAGYQWAFEVIEISKYVNLEVSQSTDPSVVFIECRGDMLMANGRPYNNNYVFRFDVEDGKLRRVREYLNPMTSALSFGYPVQADVLEALNSL
jgi:ketosteroid isomerase-like protein